MFIKSALLASLLAILPILSYAGVEYQHRLADVVLNEVGASYIIKTVNEKVRVATFEYKKPAETCKFLRKRGVFVVEVTNYSEIKNNGLMKITKETC